MADYNVYLDFMVDSLGEPSMTGMCRLWARNWTHHLDYYFTKSSEVKQHPHMRSLPGGMIVPYWIFPPFPDWQPYTTVWTANNTRDRLDSVLQYFYSIYLFYNDKAVYQMSTAGYTLHGQLPQHVILRLWLTFSPCYAALLNISCRWTNFACMGILPTP